MDKAVTINSCIVSRFSPDSEVAEAYRTLRTNVQFVNLEKPIKTLLVSSALPQEHKTVQKELFVKLEGEEEKLVSILKEHDHLTLDKIALLACLPVSTVSSTLLGLEFKGMVKSLPGKVYSRHF